MWYYLRENRLNAPKPILPKQEQDISFLFVYIHLSIILLFSQVRHISNLAKIIPDFALFLHPIQG
jgi:hypothetical protein